MLEQLHPGRLAGWGVLSLPLPLTSFKAMCNDREDLSHILNAITLHDAPPANETEDCVPQPPS